MSVFFKDPKINVMHKPKDELLDEYWGHLRWCADRHDIKNVRLCIRKIVKLEKSNAIQF